MTGAIPRGLSHLLRDVQSFHSTFVNTFGSDSGSEFHDSGAGPERKAVGASLNARATALVPNCPRDGRANEISWRLNTITAYKVSGYPGDTGREGP